MDPDLACAVCNYNLQGLPLDGNCPECGHPIPHSLAASQFANPRHLRQLGRGLSLFFFPAIYALQLQSIFALWDQPWLISLPAAGTVITFWLLASPLPGGPTPARTTAWLLRIAATAFLAAHLLAWWIISPSRTSPRWALWALRDWILTRSRSSPSWAPWWLRDRMEIAEVLLFGICMLICVERLRSLPGRLNNHSVIRHLRSATSLVFASIAISLAVLFQ